MKVDDKIKSLASFREFKSTFARLVAVLYFAFSSGLSLFAFCGHHDGGAWIYMLFIYFPASILTILTNAVAAEFISGFWGSVFNAFACIAGGTFWYYMVTKGIAYYCYKAKHNKTGQNKI